MAQIWRTAELLYLRLGSRSSHQLRTGGYLNGNALNFALFGLWDDGNGPLKRGDHRLVVFVDRDNELRSGNRCSRIVGDNMKLVTRCQVIINLMQGLATAHTQHNLRIVSAARKRYQVNKAVRADNCLLTGKKLNCGSGVFGKQVVARAQQGNAAIAVGGIGLRGIA